MATRKFLAKKQEAIIARLIAAVKRKQLTLRKKHRVPELTSSLKGRMLIVRGVTLIHGRGFRQSLCVL